MIRLGVLSKLCSIRSFLLLSSVFLLSACGGTGELGADAPRAERSSAKVKLSMPNGISIDSSGRLNAPLLALAPTAQITSITLTVTASGMNTVTTTIPVAGPYEAVLTIPSGLQRKFTVSVDTDQGTMFSGSSLADLVAGVDKALTINVTVISLPATPTGLSLSPTGTDGITVSWTAADKADSYTIYWNTTGNVTTADNAITGVTGTSYVHTGLNATDTYYYLIVSSNGAGDGTASTGVSATPDSTPPTTTALPAGGTYNASQSVTFSTNETATIYYTTDGSTPTTASTVYSSAISVSATTTLKFFAVDSAGNSEAVKTESYVIDTTVPTVTAKSPVANATGVAVNSSVSATFSEAIKSSTVTTTTFTLKQTSNSSAVAGTVGMNGGTTIATFTPSADLAGSTQYTATITTGVTDSAGNAIVSSTSWSFTTVASVTALYPTNGANWNDYVDNDGADVYSATDVACPATGAGYFSCIHGGEKRAVSVTGKSVCTNLTATDALGVFDWTCDAGTNPVKMMTTGLKSAKNLSDLLDFTTPGWLANSVTVKESATTLFTTASSTAWWGNTVSFANFGGNLAVAGMVYLVTANPSAVYTIGASKVALVIKPGLTITGDSAITNEKIIFVDGRTTAKNFLWIEGAIDGTGDKYDIEWYRVDFSVIRNVFSSNANRNGVYILSSESNYLSNIISSNNGWRGVALSRLAGTAINSDHNRLSNITVSNNGKYGIRLSVASGNSLTNITATNSGFNGVYLKSSSNNNSFSNITVANSGGHGVYLVTSSNNSFSNITAVNSGGSGVYLWTSSNNSLSNLVATNNAANGIVLDTSSNNNYFTGLLKVGNNPTADCSLLGTNTAPGLITTTCTDTGTTGSSAYAGQSSDALLTRGAGVTVASSFVGKVTTNDTVNTSDGTGGASAGTVAYATTIDWTSFQNSYRGWGKDGVTFPAFTNQGQWTTGTGRIWDWSMMSADTIINGVLTAKLTGSAANSIKHTWSGTAANQAACDALVAGSTYYALGSSCFSTYLRDASEISGDDIGNDNGLCESNETCLYTPNIGSYQGHGALISAGTFTDGASITGVTLMQYTTNGY